MWWCSSLLSTPAPALARDLEERLREWEREREDRCDEAVELSSLLSCLSLLRLLVWWDLDLDEEEGLEPCFRFLGVADGVLDLSLDLLDSWRDKRLMP
jgi:hypothetical protein